MYDEGEEEARERRARNHAARVAILGMLEMGERGLSARRIRSELPGEVTLRGLDYHLRVLESCDLIVEEDGRYKLP